jgi:hypothetical protein
MAKQKPDEQAAEQTDERTEGEPLDTRDEVSIKLTGGNPIVPERQLPGAASGRYRVAVSSLGRWQRGGEITADDVGGQERLDVLLKRGSIEEIPAEPEGEEG